MLKGRGVKSPSKKWNVTAMVYVLGHNSGGRIKCSNNGSDTDSNCPREELQPELQPVEGSDE